MEFYMARKHVWFCLVLQLVASLPVASAGGGTTRTLGAATRARGLSSFVRPLRGTMRLALPSVETRAYVSKTPSYHEVPLKRVEGLRKQYGRPTEETVVRLRNARVIWANFPLLKQDFPELADLSDEEINGWIDYHAGYVSKAQVLLGSVRGLNSEIEFTPEDEVTAYRPAGYGRALVFDTGSGLLDGKGAGARDPKPGTDGLIAVVECIREAFYERYANSLTVSEGLPFSTVGTYAILDLGFKSLKADLPAGMVLRQAHRRSPNGHDRAREVCMAFSNAGLAPDYQCGVGGQLVDFGHWNLRSKNRYAKGPVLLSPAKEQALGSRIRELGELASQGESIQEGLEGLVADYANSLKSNLKKKTQRHD